MIGYYRRLIPNFSNLAFPLSEIAKECTKKNAIFTWTPEATEAFQNLKTTLKETTDLPFAHPDVTHLQLVTDSSQVAIGAALHQMVNGQLVPTDFYGRKLTEPQRRYSTFDRELLAAYYAVLH